MIATSVPPAGDGPVCPHRPLGEGRAPPLTTRLSGKRIGILGLGRIGHAPSRSAPSRSAGRSPIIREAPRRMCRGAMRRTRWRLPPRWTCWSSQPRAGPIPGTGRQGGDRRARAHRHADQHRARIGGGRGSAGLGAGRGRLGGAGLDVFAHEPHVPEALIAMENVVLIPHVGSATRETRAGMARLRDRQCRRLLRRPGRC